jgi:folate-binding protein YgfZ
MDTTYYPIIIFSGEDRHSFLQGQLTQDVGKIRDAAVLPTALCNAKGRVVVTGRLMDLGDRVGMTVPAPMVAAVIQRLSMYRLRADVQIGLENEMWLAVAFSDENSLERLGKSGLLPDAQLGASKRSSEIIAVHQAGTERYVELFGQVSALQAINLDMTRRLDDKTWQRERIVAGLVDIVPENTEQYTPHMLNLDLTGALSFSKGCYTGQEVVARTEHLGSVKRRLKRYRISDCEPKIGDSLSDRDGNVGKVVNVSTEEILAVTPVEKHEIVLTLGNGTATPLPLPYAI